MYACISLRIKIKTMFACLTAAAVLITGGSLVFAHNTPKSTPADGVRLPAIMYHSVVEDNGRQGKYVVTPNNVENDLRYLKENGYTGVLVADLIAYVYQNKPLPDKPVLITLDDGFLNNLIYVLPLLEQYDMKAVISVVGAYTDLASEQKERNPLYTCLNWDDLKTLHASGRVEIGHHSYDRHRIDERNGCAKKKGESYEQYKAFFLDDYQTFQDVMQAHLGTQSMVYTYPFGSHSPESADVLKEIGLKAALICYERVNTITKDPQCLYHIGRFNRPGKMSTEQFMKKIEH